jgi:NodT family efflux transporter outer membrane factor (OMF) lipoprotein
VKRFYILALSGLLLNGCTTATDFAQPYLEFFKTNAYKTQAQKQIDQNPMSNWWDRIQDEQISQNVDTLLTQNLALKQGFERIQQAQESVNIIRGGKSPTLGIDLQGGRSFENSSTTGSRAFSNTLSTSLTSSWQLDLFGKISDQERSAQSSLEATQYDQEALKHSLVAELVTKHVAVATYQKLLSIAQKNINNRKQVLNLVKRRYNGGVANTTTGDMYAAQSALTSTKADAHDFERILNENLYAIDVLLGQTPKTTKTTGKNYTLTPSNINVAHCLPMDLLDRRPDLKSSALRLQASKFDVDIAVADLYPSLSLSGALGFSGNDDSQFFTADKLAGSILGAITTRLFEGDTLRSNIRLEKSEAREMSLAYSETILNAITEVETALMANDHLKQQIKHQKRSLNALKKSETFAKNRYENGLQTMQNYLDIQQNKYLAEQKLYQIYQSHWDNRIALYLALGGDWFNNEEKADACTQGTTP